jgi:hypothetical protein
MGAGNAIVDLVRYHYTMWLPYAVNGTRVKEAVSIGFRLESLVRMLGEWIKWKFEQKAN